MYLDKQNMLKHGVNSGDFKNTFSEIKFYNFPLSPSLSLSLGLLLALCNLLQRPKLMCGRRGKAALWPQLG